MSAFHKPKLYRTAAGCCICKAKSSSSRFTSSGKYEDFFSSCFLLSEPRGGEICNACVLLVKRYKKLPSGSSRHWAHVVDARAGPGVKNFVRERRRESCRERSFKKKHVYRRKRKNTDCSRIETSVSDDSDNSLPLQSTNQPTEPKVSDFIDLNIWKRKLVCCGTIFVGPYGEVMVDPRFLHKCLLHAKPKPKPVQLPKMPNSLFTIEKIIESELRNLESSNAVTESSLDMTESGKRASPSALPGDPESDEGFYDKPSISPTNSI